MEEEQAEVEEGASDRAAVDQHVLFGQMPAARPHQEVGGFVVEAIGLAVGIIK